ncbi:hypothetical protein V6Z11_1Z129700 [Gossypium hirsutum]
MEIALLNKAKSVPLNPSPKIPFFCHRLSGSEILHIRLIQNTRRSRRRFKIIIGV